MNLSNKQRKLITSLRQKKYRIQSNLFIAEGEKVISEFLKSNYSLQSLYVTSDKLFLEHEPVLISEEDLKKMSNLITPNKALAIFKIPEFSKSKFSSFILALDSINDPGNLGTIIRLCDWFGVDYILCSDDTVDCYSPKVVQASMGSLARVSVEYLNLELFLKETNLPVFIADMNGKIVYEVALPKEAVLVMGNEANGISNNILELGNQIISIPRFGKNQITESLNVSTATSILLSEFNRQQLFKG